MGQFSFLQLLLALKNKCKCDWSWRDEATLDFNAPKTADPFIGRGLTEFGHDLARSGTCVIRKVTPPDAPSGKAAPGSEKAEPDEVSLDVRDLDAYVTDAVLFYVCRHLNLSPQKVARAAMYEDTDRQRDH